MFSKENLVAGGALAASSIVFLFWGFDYLPGNYTLFIVATVFGIFMAFNIGGNDVANSFGTSVGAKTLTIKQALVIAAIFEISGALLAGGEVTKTIRKGIVSIGDLQFDPMLFVFVMMGSLLAAGTWLLFASRRGLPVSTTHSIVGGIVGGSLALGAIVVGEEGSSLDLVNWSKIGTIALSWVISPILGGLLSYGIYWYLKRYILDYNEKIEADITEAKLKCDRLEAEYDEAVATDEDKAAYEAAMQECKILQKKPNAFFAIRKHVPIAGAFAAAIITGMLLFKGLKKLKLEFTVMDTTLIILAFTALAYGFSYALVKVMKKDTPTKATIRVFSILQVATASAFAFSHGANDIANAIGPFAAIIDVLATGELKTTAPVPAVAMLTFGVALITGLWFLGKEVIQTVGTRLAEIFPVTGFAAELGASAVILGATKFGIPVSSTHILIGAVIGIGVLNKDANWSLMRPIALAWIVTLPVAGVLAAVFFYLLKILFGY
jgi:PiT family inorganic phosphate transporter